MPEPTPENPWVRRVFAALIPLLAFVTLGAWAIASPVGSSPDDDFHLVSLWCAHGEKEGLCQESGDPSTRLVHLDFVTDAICFKRQADVNASCQNGPIGGPSPVMALTDHGNFSGLYPPGYYATMGVFATDAVTPSILAIRLVNAALFVGFATATFLLLPRHRRETLTWSILLTIVPLGAFTVPSINPSSWAILAAPIVWLAFVGYFETEGRRRWALGGLGAAAAIMASNARADAAAYSCLAVGIAVLLTARRGRDFRRLLLLPALVVAVAVASYASASQGATAAGVGLSTGSLAGLTTMQILAVDIVELPGLWLGALGQSPLGWLDTPMPAVVWIATGSCFAVAIVLGLARRWGRKTAAFALAALAATLIPLVAIVRAEDVVGGAVQPRYILPLMTLGLGVALLRRSTDAPALTAGRAVAAATALAIANSVALFTNIKRYTIGANVAEWNLDEYVDWWWTDAYPPSMVWGIGSLAFAGFLALYLLHDAGKYPPASLTSPIVGGGGR